MIPSHIGIQGNEEADLLAKNTLTCDTISIKISPSLNQIKQRAIKYVWTEAKSAIARAVMAGSTTSKWYTEVTQLKPHGLAKHVSRKKSVTTQTKDKVQMFVADGQPEPELPIL